MSEASNPTTSTSNGEKTPTDGTAVTPEGKSSLASKLTTHPKVQRAVALAKSHPLGAVATVAAAAALVEIEFAVGLLTGLGATALLAGKSGPEAREQVIARGKQAIAQARTAIAKRKKPPTEVAAAGAPPPA